MRHGTLHLVRATFAGFKALPAPEGKHWRDVLALPSDTKVTKDVIEGAYKRLALAHHPDKGGSAETMAEITNAKVTALKEIGA